MLRLLHPEHFVIGYLAIKACTFFSSILAALRLCISALHCLHSVRYNALYDTIRDCFKTSVVISAGRKLANINSNALSDKKKIKLLLELKSHCYS